MSQPNENGYPTVPGRRPGSRRGRIPGCPEPSGPARFALPALFTLVGALLWAPLIHARGKDLLFNHLSLEEGLSQVSVTCIIQDRKGFMWFATEGGLNRYDGYRFVNYRHRPADPGSLADNAVHALLEDRRGNLWAAAGTRGLDRLDPESGAFDHFLPDPPNPNSLSDGQVTALLEGGAASSPFLWIGTLKGGMQRLEVNRRRFTTYRHLPDDPGSLGHDTVNGILEQPGSGGNVLWVATAGGLDRFDVRLNRFTHFRAGPGGLSHDHVKAIAFTDPLTLWAGTLGGGLNRLDLRTGAVTVFRKVEQDPASLSDDFVNVLLRDSAGRLWVGTDKGLNLRVEDPPGFVRFLHNPFFSAGLNDSMIVSLCEDRSQVLWVGTWSGGINKADNKAPMFTAVLQRPGEANSLIHNTVRDIVQDRRGALWIGTTEGLDRYDRATGVFTHFLRDPARPDSLSFNYVLDLYEDGQGTLWVGTMRGLNRYDDRTGVFRRHFHDPANPASLSSDEIQRVIDDPVEPDRYLWVGTRDRGLNRFDKATGACVRYLHDPGNPLSMGNDKVYALLPAGGGKLWVGTWEGLDRFDPGTGVFEHFPSDPGNPASLSNGRVTCIERDPSGHADVLWVGTWGGGLNRFDVKARTFRSYSENTGFPSDLVSGVLADGDGKLWVSSPRGVARFDPATGEARAYTVPVGEKNNAYNGGAFFRGADGEMFFGGLWGMTSFFPRNVRDNPHVPPVVLTSFRVFNREAALPRPLSETREIVLSHADKYLAFEFAGLEYTAPGRNRYKFRLEGFDADWVQTDAGHRTATYTNLDPGEYTFRVIACNNDGVWNPEGVSVRVVVVPPFWRTTGFRVLTAAVLVLAVFGLYRLRVRHIRRRARELEETNRVLNREVLERQRAEAQVRKSEQRLLTFLETAQEGFIEVDEQEIVLDVNPELCRIMGRPREELLGRSFFDFIRQEDLESFQEEVGRRAKGKTGSYALTLIKPDTTPVHCLVNASPLFDPDGRRRGSFALVTNITEMKQAEAQLRQAQKMETIGTLAGGLAHDFNNVLGGISGTLSVIKFKYRGKSSIGVQELEPHLRVMEEASARAADMVKRLLTLSRQQELAFESVDLGVSVSNVITLCENTFDKSIGIRWSPPAEAARVRADATQVEQVLLNLCVNASHAMTLMRPETDPPGGTLTVSLRKILSDKIFCYTHPEAGELKAFWVVSISDTGVGMSSKIIAKMFDPFFTTKQKGVGTGLGLSTVYSIVQQHGGFIDVYSEPGIGSTFNVYFPVPAGEKAGGAGAGEEEPLPRGTGTILVVDDEKAIRDAAKAFLEYCGYTVLLAGDGLEAVDVFRARHAEIRVVLLDVVMPRMSGREAFLELRKIRPDVRVIVASGFQIDGRVRSLLDLGAQDTIHKPFALNELAHKIAALAPDFTAE
ncbi:MAG: PAS domain S-box protein [Acidobacteria bacterium]|nr:PAS domain S-box protein [Acidobacteriota bacterium]